jgi:hypothetical protein
MRSTVTILMSEKEKEFLLDCPSQIFPLLTAEFLGNEESNPLKG